MDWTALANTIPNNTTTKIPHGTSLKHIHYQTLGKIRLGSIILIYVNLCYVY
jgi:hypothetical protein